MKKNENVYEKLNENVYEKLNEKDNWNLYKNH